MKEHVVVVEKAIACENCRKKRRVLVIKYSATTESEMCLGCAKKNGLTVVNGMNIQDVSSERFVAYRDVMKVVLDYYYGHAHLQFMKGNPIHANRFIPKNVDDLFENVSDASKVKVIAYRKNSIIIMYGHRCKFQLIYPHEIMFFRWFVQQHLDFEHEQGFEFDKVWW